MLAMIIRDDILVNLIRNC